MIPSPSPPPPSNAAPTDARRGPTTTSSSSSSSPWVPSAGVPPAFPLGSYKAVPSKLPNACFVRPLTMPALLSPSEIGHAAARGVVGDKVRSVNVDWFVRHVFTQVLALPQVTAEQLEEEGIDARRCPLCGTPLVQSKFGPECDFNCLVAVRDGCLRCGSDSHKVDASRKEAKALLGRPPEEREARLLSCCAVVVNGLHLGSRHERAADVCDRCLVPHDLFDRPPSDVRKHPVDLPPSHVRHPVVMGSVNQVLHLVYANGALRARLARDFGAVLYEGDLRSPGTGHLASFPRFFRWAMHGARNTLPYAVYVVVWWLVVSERVVRAS
jgi:hypothetical protein